MEKNYFSELGSQVHSFLKRHHQQGPPRKTLAALFEAMYVTSLKKEEGETITCMLVYLNPHDPDPSPPELPPAERWKCFRLEETVPLNPRNLAKLAKAVDPSTSALAVYHDENHQLYIWGIIDQVIHYHSFKARDKNAGPERPGAFQATITGPGEIVVERDYKAIAALRQSEIVTSYLDLFKIEPFASTIQNFAKAYENEVRQRASEPTRPRTWGPIDIEEGVASDWYEALSRILLGIQRYRHGGAILITPSTNAAGLNVKYKWNYDRIHDALVRRALHAFNADVAEDKIYSDYIQAGRKPIPVDLYLDENVENSEKDRTEDEVTGAIRTVASLSRIDGLIWVDPRLRIKGFGVEITIRRDPPLVQMLSEERGGASGVRTVKPTDFGTRHRSMMRFCYQRPGSVGFVISQDLAIRAIMRHGDGVLICDNICVEVNL